MNTDLIGKKVEKQIPPEDKGSSGQTSQLLSSSPRVQAQMQMGEALNKRSPAQMQALTGARGAAVHSGPGEARNLPDREESTAQMRTREGEASVVQRVLGEQEKEELQEAFTANPQWQDGAKAAFETFAEDASDQGLEVDEIVPYLSQVGPGEFVRISGALGNDVLLLMLGRNLGWNEVKFYEQHALAAIPGAYQGYIHGANVGDFDHFITALRNAGDATVGAAANLYDPATERNNLAATYPAPNTFAVVNGQIRINNGIALAPRKISELQADMLDGIVRNTRILDDAASAPVARQNAQTYMNRLGTSGSQRFRYDAQAQIAYNFLLPLVPAASHAAFDALWNAPNAPHFRAFDLYNNYHTVPRGGANMNQQAGQYASAQNAGNLSDWVNHFEFYRGFLEQELNDTVDWYYELLRDYTDPDGDNMPLAAAQAQAAERAFGDATRIPGSADAARRVGRQRVAESMGGADLSAGGRQQVEDRYADYLDALGNVPNSVGPQALPGGEVSPRTRMEQIRAISGTLGFGSNSAAAYHAQKHSGELPADERTGNSPEERVTDYVASARNAIANGEWSYRIDQSGRESHYFTLGHLRAIVGVDPAVPNAVIATYFSA
jgi:hypothetical protein